MSRRNKVRNRGQFQARGQWLRNSKRVAIYERDGWICGGHLADGVNYCGEYLAGRPDDQITVDHIVPRNLGGMNHESNLVTCCVNCNARKAGKENIQVNEKQSIDELPITSSVAFSPPASPDREPAVPAAGPPKLHLAPPPKQVASPGVNLRDRIVDFRRIHSRELMDHEGNWRRHPAAQRNALAGVLGEIGIVQALVVYKSQRAGGKWVVIDGHLRKNEFEADWPCVIVDLTDDEADLQLQAHDAVGAMALADRRMMDELRERQQFQDAGVRLMLDQLADELTRGKRKKKDGGPDDEAADDNDEQGESIKEMELAPYEHYDYLLVLARNTFDWNWLCERLGLERVDGGTDPKAKKIGLGRAIPADVLIKHLRHADEIIASNRT